MMMYARRAAEMLFVACFFACSQAGAQPGLVERVDSVFDAIREGLNRFGEKTEDVVGRIPFPGNADPIDLSALVTQTRVWEKQFAANKGHAVSITSQYGSVRVQSWENPVIRVVANITASAPTLEIASSLVQAIMVNPTAGDRLLEVTSTYPDSRGLGKIDMKVNYEIYVPRDARLMCKNSFADTEVRAIGGAVELDSLGGMVTLERIDGPVTVRARGDYPLRATGLARGGTFTLRGAASQFIDVGGVLHVSSFDGGVELRRLRPEIQAEIVSKNGPLHVYLPEGARLALDAIVLFGEIQSEGFPLDYPSRGNLTHARMTNPQSNQNLSLETSFENIYLHRESEGAAEGILASQEDLHLLTRELSPINAPCPDGFELIINAMPGNLRVEGDDIEEVIVSATQLIRLDKEGDAARAFGVMELRLETVENRLELHSARLDELGQLGAASARTDLFIRCPRTVPIEIRAAKGHTTLEGTGSDTTIAQLEGSVAVQHHKGPLMLSNQKGDINVSECEGPVTMNAWYGTANAFNVFGKLDIECFKGTTIIEAAQGEVVSRSQAGDVKILATELIGGNYDITAEGGTISIILSPTANATVFATAKNGVVHNNSPVLINGSKIKGVENFSGTFNEGLFNLKLNAIGGDVIVTQEQ